MLTALLYHLLNGLPAPRSGFGTNPELRDLPPEIRKDIGWPDSCTARMTMRGHKAACHERW